MSYVLTGWGAIGLGVCIFLAGYLVGYHNGQEGRDE